MAHVRGFVDPEFRSLVRALELYVPVRGFGGAAVCVHHRGRVVAHAAIGTRDRSGAPMQPETLVMSLSTSKGVTATLVHILADRGILDLDAPVARYWPEFAQSGKSAITISDVLGHRAGLYVTPADIREPEQLYDWDTMAAAMARAAPAHAPGRDFGYHAWTFGWILGELMQRAAGASVPALLRELIADPLGLGGLYIGLPDHERPRLASIRELELPPLSRAWAAADGVATIAGRAARGLGLRYEPDAMLQTFRPSWMGALSLNDPAFLRAVIPSLNGVFDALSLSRLYAALAGGGELDGVRLLSRETIERARRDQNAGLGRVIPFPLRIKLGYHRPVSLGVRASVLGRERDFGISSADAFGHFGLGGSGAWADQSRDLAVAVVTNCFIGRLPADVRTVGVCTAANYAADRASGRASGQRWGRSGFSRRPSAP